MNLNHFYYRGYYSGYDPRQLEDKSIEKNNEKHFIAKNKILIGYKPQESLLKQLIPTKTQFGENLESFKLETIYPGLFTGSGYEHETGSVGEFKLGFFFDFTTGLPILPGHSVKGTLRSVFPRFKVLKTDEPVDVKRLKARYIIEKLRLADDAIPDDRIESWVTKLELAIFEGQNPEWDGKDKKSHYLPIMKRDIFLDGVITEAPQNGNGAILGADAITPHGGNPLKNPIPLPFIKVLPGVRWQFSFLLHPVKIEGIDISAKVKIGLFESILSEIGIGAKTNSGYGHFKPIDGIKKSNSSQSSPGQIAAQFPQKRVDWKNPPLLDAEIVVSGTPNKVKVYLSENQMPVLELMSYKNPIEAGKIVTVKGQFKKNGELYQVNFSSFKK